MGESLFIDAINGDRRALARAMTQIDDGAADALSAVAALTPRRASRPGAPFVLGVTGPPGAGKSTFTNRVIARARASGERVAVLAVDPSSPFSGGAILGDRLRMEAHAADPGVFIRSLSSRGHLGGLSRATGQVVDLLDAAGYDRVILETVGVGQSELSVMGLADTVLVVLTPESGDVVQTMKAGLLEVADVFAVNKADRPGADGLRRNLELMVHLGMSDEVDEHRWAIPVHTCCASKTGVWTRWLLRVWSISTGSGPPDDGLGTSAGLTGGCVLFSMSSVRMLDCGLLIWCERPGLRQRFGRGRSTRTLPRPAGARHRELAATKPCQRSRFPPRRARRTPGSNGPQ